MLSSNMLVAQALGFFGSEVQNSFALLTQRNLHRSRNAFAHGNARFNFFPDGFDRAMRPQEPVRERFILAQQSQQQMLGLDIGASVLARLVSGKKDYAPSFLCIAFKHGSPKVFPGTPCAVRRLWRMGNGLGKLYPGRR